MSNLIEERDERTRKRKKFKRRMDAIIGLSFHDEEKKCMELSVNTMNLSDRKIRLLDEGYIDNGFVIKKGTIEKFLNGQNTQVRGYRRNDDGEWEQTEVLNLTDDFVGTVNLGHMDFATFPFIIGEWRKQDLSVVDIENDRKALDVKLHLDRESTFVKELKRQPYDIGVSAEFFYHMNEEDTQNLSEMLGYWMPVIDEIFINAYALVGECGNVNSSGLELKGDMDMPKDIENNVMEVENDAIETENDVIEEAVRRAVSERVSETVTEETEVTEVTEAETENLSAEETVIDEETAEIIEESADEEVTEETEELSAEEETAQELSEAAQDEETGEEVEAEETELVVSEEGEDEEADLEEILSVVNDLKDTVAKLTAKVGEQEDIICELKKTNKRLSNKLKDEKKKKQAFIESAKNISVKLGVNEEKPKKESVADTKFAFGDGIGD